MVIVIDRPLNNRGSKTRILLFMTCFYDHALRTHLELKFLKSREAFFNYPAGITVGNFTPPSFNNPFCFFYVFEFTHIQTFISESTIK